MIQKLKSQSRQKRLVKCQTFQFTPWDQNGPCLIQQQPISTDRKQIIQRFLSKVIDHNKYLTKLSCQSRLKTLPNSDNLDDSVYNEKKALSNVFRSSTMKIRQQKSLSKLKTRNISQDLRDKLNFPIMKKKKDTSKKSKKSLSLDYYNKYIESDKSFQNFQNYDSSLCYSPVKGQKIFYMNNKCKQWIENSHKQVSQVFTNHRLIGSKLKKFNKFNPAVNFKKNQIYSRGKAHRGGQLDPLFRKVLQIGSIQKL